MYVVWAFWIQNLCGALPQLQMLHPRHTGRMWPGIHLLWAAMLWSTHWENFQSEVLSSTMRTSIIWTATLLLPNGPWLPTTRLRDILWQTPMATNSPLLSLRSTNFVIYRHLGCPSQSATPWESSGSTRNDEVVICQSILKPQRKSTLRFRICNRTIIKSRKFKVLYTSVLLVTLVFCPCQTKVEDFLLVPIQCFNMPHPTYNLINKSFIPLSSEHTFLLNPRKMYMKHKNKWPQKIRSLCIN
jgi:hypothetical protein